MFKAVVVELRIYTALWAWRRVSHTRVLAALLVWCWWVLARLWASGFLSAKPERRPEVSFSSSEGRWVCLAFCMSMCPEASLGAHRIPLTDCCLCESGEQLWTFRVGRQLPCSARHSLCCWGLLVCHRLGAWSPEPVRRPRRLKSQVFLTSF